MLADDRHVADAQLVVAEALAHLVEEVVVDLVDDLEVAGQQAAEQVDRPHLEGLGKKRVAGVREALLRDRPRGIPIHLLLVGEHAHELGHGDDGVRVVELEDHPLGKLREVVVRGELRVEEVGDRRGDEEVLLLQAQLLALRGRVLGVQHLRDVLGVRLGANGLFVVARVEDAQIERVGRDRAPQPEGVDAAVVVAGDHVVVGHGLDVPARDPAVAGHAVVVVVLGVAAERDHLGGFGVRELPRRAEREPRVGLLDLLAALEGLAEDAVFIADAVADARDAHGRERIDEARREPAEAAVAEPRLDLLLTQLFDVDAARGHRLGRDVGEPRREQVVVELAAEQILGGQVADALGLRHALTALVFEPACHQVVAHRVGEGEVAVVRAGRRQRHTLLEVEVLQELLDEPVDARGRCGHRGESERMLRADQAGRGGRGGFVVFGHPTTLPNVVRRIPVNGAEAPKVYIFVTPAPVARRHPMTRTTDASPSLPGLPAAPERCSRHPRNRSMSSG